MLCALYFRKFEASKFHDGDMTTKIFKASVRNQLRQCLQSCVEAMRTFDGAMQQLLSGIDEKNSPKFVGIIDGLKNLVIANQRQFAGTALSEAKKVLDSSRVLMQNVPDPTQKEKAFLKYLKAEKSNASSFTSAKRSLDKAQADLNDLGDEWKHTSDDWDNSPEGTIGDVARACGELAADLESAVLIFALVSQLRTAGISQPGGEAPRKKCLDLWTTLRSRKELVCPKSILKEAEEMLMSFGDSKVACQKALGGHVDHASGTQADASMPAEEEHKSLETHPTITHEVNEDASKQYRSPLS